MPQPKVKAPKYAAHRYCLTLVSAGGFRVVRKARNTKHSTSAENPLSTSATTTCAVQPVIFPGPFSPTSSALILRSNFAATSVTNSLCAAGISGSDLPPLGVGAGGSSGFGSGSALDPRHRFGVVNIAHA